jgi:hypothetical protein
MESGVPKSDGGEESKVTAKSEVGEKSSVIV